MKSPTLIVCQALALGPVSRVRHWSWDNSKAQRQSRRNAAKWRAERQRTTKPRLTFDQAVAAMTAKLQAAK